MAAAGATAVARWREDGRKCAVFIEAEQERRDDGQAATAEYVRAENTVLRAEDKQSDKNPKGGITLSATIHKNLLCFAAGYVIKFGCRFGGIPKRQTACGFVFLLHSIRFLGLLCNLFAKRGEKVGLIIDFSR